jgi:hypothetical protein
MSEKLPKEYGEAIALLQRLVSVKSEQLYNYLILHSKLIKHVI